MVDSGDFPSQVATKIIVEVCEDDRGKKFGSEKIWEKKF